ncbi:hypothetical protein QVD17_38887 [Tagetes erecta]|uniref:non-specific serine/threonine protein kinase n=1 Tax=Tagetes erecta TaxID=13708 RepID=A0AAD8JP07_TARER|nr:hypothetical protein QVD17_38887 [Tagetes erecta]
MASPPPPLSTVTNSQPSSPPPSSSQMVLVISIGVVVVMILIVLFVIICGERPVMQFATRLRIAIGTAKALAYLHEDSPVKIIHRDIKAANILLDSNFEAIVRPLLSQVLEDGNFDPIVDPNLQPNYSHDDMTKMLTCADVCVSDVPMLRPRMSMVVRVLEGAASVWELKFGSSRST